MSFLVELNSVPVARKYYQAALGLHNTLKSAEPIEINKNNTYDMLPIEKSFWLIKISPWKSLAQSHNP